MIYVGIEAISISSCIEKHIALCVALNAMYSLQSTYTMPWIIKYRLINL